MDTARRSPVRRAAPLLAAALAAFAAASHAVPSLADDVPQEKCAPDPQQQAADLEKEIAELFAAGRYEEAAAKCRAEIDVVPKRPDPRYNLACALSRLGKKDEAVAALTAAVELGFDDGDHMKADEDLAAVRDHASFADLVARAQKNAETGTYDPGIAIPDVTHLDRAPEGGLRYRLLVPKSATAQKPARLLVWLHPSGGSMNSLIEGHAPQWLDAGWAVLLPTQKRWSSWSEAEASKLLTKSLPDAATVPGIDTKRPVLMGFSAGGQMALQLWSQDCSRFGGLFLDAAYPLDAAAYQRGERKLLDPPAGDAAKKVPIFVLVGGADPGQATWKSAEEPWRKAGVPLVVHVVPDGRHEWLLRAGLLLDFARWLGDVAAGRLPGAADPGPAVPAK